MGFGIGITVDAAVNAARNYLGFTMRDGGIVEYARRQQRHVHHQPEQGEAPADVSIPASADVRRRNA